VFPRAVEERAFELGIVAPPALEIGERFQGLAREQVSTARAASAVAWCSVRPLARRHGAVVLDGAR